MRGIELTPERPIDELTERAVDAEAAGFDTVFASNHYNNRDAMLALGQIASATDVDVGLGVANPYETHPVTLASSVATLQELSDGRAIYGIGAGDRSTLANLGVEHDRPLRRVLESFKVAQDLWAGKQVDHDGTFEASDASLNYDIEGEIPVYVGAQGPHMIRMSAKHADGVLVNAAHPDDFEWAATQVEKGLDQRPPERGAFDVAAYASVSVAEDEAAARQAARPPTAFIVGGAAPPVLDRHGIDEAQAADVGQAVENGNFSEAFEAVTPAMLDAFCVAGTPADVERQVERILEYADSFVAAAPLGPDLETAIALLGDAVDQSDPA